MKYPYVFFDLDGTLTDPGLGITNSIMYALKKFNIEETDRTALYKFIGPPLLDSFEQFYGFSKTDSWKALEYYREYFGVKGLFENEVYPGVYNLLQSLREKGHILMVATSKPTEYTTRILERFTLSKYFDYVSGSDMNEKNSDKAMIIENALKINNIDPKSVIMVGDREHDIIGAKKNNVDSIGVLYGYGSREELLGAGADYICQRVEDIRDIIN